MILEDKIYFIDDILDEYEKRGGDREAAEALYWTTREELLENISSTDGVVYKIDNFGNLYYPLSSLHNLINKVDKVINKKGKFTEVWVKRKQILKDKLENMSSLIDIARKNKVKNIWFFRKRFNQREIKNG